MKKKQISAQEILKIQQNVSNIVKGKIEELNYQLLKVLLIKEENKWYLRIYINSDNGIDLNDCETVSKAIDEL
ncbi:MAG TPA: ribosome maturation factor RimP, partial [Clostridiaceae bacterium]|nr:ribosome maturation factor RimP [Clostridiaceae bacterium]